jgi:SAM-dependent methyltransferase
MKRVTSDCRPWPAGGRLAACRACGVLQKPQDPRWDADCRAIYADYLLYPQGGGAEQAVFDLASGAAAARSDRLLDRILAGRSLLPAGRILDVGCGNGEFLRAFHRRAPGWRLNGTELHDRYRKEIESIEGIEAFHQCLPDEVDGEFDWIVFLHVLEHVPAPAALLRRLRAKLCPGGVLLVELPDHRQNPFDLAVADHSCHFSAETLRATLERAGYVVETLVGDWIPREHTALSRGDGRTRAVCCDAGATLAGARSALRWLAAMADHARSLAAERPIGVFGSSIAASWLTAELEDRVAFFVDEDPHRDGRSHCGRPIYSPGRCPAGVPVYVALPSAQAAAVVERLRGRGMQLIAPPAAA